MDNDEGVSDLGEHRNNVIQYVLNNSCTKFPLKHAEILNTVLNGNGVLLNKVLQSVKEALENTYGILLKDVPNTKSGKQYICISKFPAVSRFEFTETQRSEITLLFLVLSYIYMKGIAVAEECLAEFLKGLRIYFDQPHPYFGANVKKLVTETFVKQLYLKKVKSDSDSIENTLFYSWGYRSEVEFPQRDILEAVSKLLNKPAKHFILQFTQANLNETSNE